MALFVTLIMVVVILLIMGTISYQQQLDFKRSSRMLLSDQVVLLALSGESWAKKILRDDAQDNQTDSLQDDWAQTLPVLPVEGGLLTGCLLDLNARFNINNLGNYTTKKFQDDLNSLSGSPVDTYLNLLALLELESTDERAAVIVDWVDSNDEYLMVGSAEDTEYSLEDPPRLAANAPLTDRSELVTIYGYSSADLSALRPYISTLGLGQAAEMNVNTASRNILMSLLAGMDEYVADAIIENRPFESKADFYSFVSDELGYLSVEEVKRLIPEQLIGVVSQYFELNARVSIVGMDMGLRSTLYRNGVGPVLTLSRTFEYLPRLALQDDQVDPLISPCTQLEEGSIETAI